MKRTSMNNTTTTGYPQIQPWALPGTAWGWPTRPSRLESLAAGFAPISLAQMDAVALLNRSDTKFVLTTGQLHTALTNLQNDYWMLEIGGQRLHPYRTLYFDTPGFALFNLHVNDRAERYKVRSREYPASQRSFFEVKHKTAKGRTIKARIPTRQPLAEITSEAEDWLQGVFPFDGRELEPKLWNRFTRLTLVSKQYSERLTLDVDLAFYTAGRTAQLGELAIAELKMDARKGDSPFLKEMHAQKIHPRGFSKYCIGVSLLYDQVKKNILKPKLLWLQKMNHGVAYDE